VALAMIGVLLETPFVTANCMTLNTGKPGPSVEHSNSGPDGAEGDAGCRAFCFCCHFAGVLNTTDVSLSLMANGFLAPNWNPLPPQFSMSPLDHPPRA
jgi:hypothetical protein